MTRDAQRRLASALMFGIGTGVTAACFFTSHPYVGIVTAVFAVQGLRGLFGANIFRDSLLVALDPAHDGNDFIGDVGTPRVRFEQRRGKRGVVVELFDEKIVATSFGFGTRQRFAVSYESLLRDPVAYSEPREPIPRVLYFSFAFFGLLGLLLVVLTDDASERLWYFAFAAGAGALCAALYRFEHRDEVPLVQLSEGTPALVLFADQPSPEAVVELVKTIRERRAKYLTENPGQLLAAPLVETLERLFHLKQSGAITDEEFERLKAEAMRKSASGGERPGNYV